jgi:hypothetical protein
MKNYFARMELNIKIKVFLKVYHLRDNVEKYCAAGQNTATIKYGPCESHAG